MGNSSKEGRTYNKTSLNSSNCLEVARPRKAFQLFVHEKEGKTLGVLTQRLGPEPQHVAYLSKRRNPVDRLKPPCLQNLAAIVILIADVLKLSFRGKLIIFTSHLNGNPLQNYCLENPMDGGAWPSTVHGSQRVRHN